MAEALAPKYNDIIRDLIGFKDVFQRILIKIKYKSDFVFALFHFSLMAQGMKCIGCNSNVSIKKIN